MTKRIFSAAAMILGFSQLALADGGGSSVNHPGGMSNTVSQLVYRIVPVVRTSESSALPPKLQATFYIQCNQDFIKVVRFDVKNSENGGKNILLGALVAEDPSSICSSVRDLTVDAGSTYSGVKYEIHPINPVPGT